MSPRQRLESYRALRDSALRLVREDIAMVREDLATRGLGARASDRVTEATLDLLDDALDLADHHRGAVAAGLGTLATAWALWLARRPILDALAEALSSGDEQGEDDDDDGEPAVAAAR